MCSGVSKSGSPIVSMTTCSPRALKSRAFCDMRMIAPSSEWAARRERSEAASNGAMPALSHAPLAPSRTPMHYEFNDESTHSGASCADPPCIMLQSLESWRDLFGRRRRADFIALGAHLLQRPALSGELHL